MSITFSIRGESYDVDDSKTYMNLSNVNAKELYIRLGFDTFAGECFGEMRARELAGLCRRELTPTKRCLDVGLPPHNERGYTFAGRPAGRINMRIKELLDLCERAGDLGLISWG